MRFEQFYLEEKVLAYLPATSIEKEFLPEPIIELFVDPSQSELQALYRSSPEKGVRIGIDSMGRIYAWHEFVLHEDMLKKVRNYDGIDKAIPKISFVLKLIHTLGDNRIFLSSDNNNIKSEAQLLGILPKEKLKRLKLFFPTVQSINSNDSHKPLFNLK